MVTSKTSVTRRLNLQLRRGTSAMGCLTLIVILTAAIYVGVHVSKPYYRYYSFKDSVKQEVRFAALRSDDAIKQSLWSAADSLGLPEEAYHLSIQRTARRVRVSGAYTDSWTVGSYTRPVRFELMVEE